jgi:hypothetical protein
MKIVIDMNLTPLWVDVLDKHGWQAIHWSTIGDPRAPLTELQLNFLGGGTLLVSLLPIWILKKRRVWKFNRPPQFQNTQ